MPISKLLLPAVILSAFVCLPVDAECIRNENVPTFNLDMIVGRVIVMPNTPIGSVLASRTYTMSGADAVYTCTGINVFEAKVIANGMQELADKIFSTNIPGIGLRFKRKGEVTMTYPDTLSVNVGGTYHPRLAGSTFELEVIKTAAVTGSGRVASGAYTTYDLIGGNNPLFTTSLSANALTIVSPSCLVTGGNNQSVNIGTIRQNQLSGKGSSAGGRSFPLELRCSGGVNLSEATNIKMTFEGTLATGTNATQGVLINEAAGSEAAQGVGVQILNSDHTTLEMGKSQWIGTLHGSETHVINLEYFARFYQYLDTISPGEVRSHLVFNIDYD